MMPGGYAGGSGSSDASLSQPSFFFLPFFLPALTGTAGGALAALQSVQSGTRWLMISSAIAEPGTRALQWMQDAVANEPWHCTTRCTPASVSSVSMFCV